MSNQVGKRIGIGVAVALLTWLLLALLMTALILNGAVAMKDAPLWLLRVAGAATGILSTMVKKPRKRKRKKRR